MKRSEEYMKGYRAGYAAARSRQIRRRREHEAPARAARQLLEGFYRGLKGEELMAAARNRIC